MWFYSRAFSTHRQFFQKLQQKLRECYSLYIFKPTLRAKIILFCGFMALLHLQQSRSMENHVGLGPIQTEEMLNSKVSG